MKDQLSDAEKELLASFFVKEEPWRQEAACRDCPDTNVFYPEGRGIGPREYAEAKSYCVRCPVQEECLDYACRTGQKYGVWGGVYGKALGVAKRDYKRCSTSKAKVE